MNVNMWAVWTSMWVTSLIGMVGQMPWTLMFLLTPYFFRVRLYTITSRAECRRIQKRIGRSCTHSVDNNRGHGYAIGKYYLAFISICSNYSGDASQIWMIADEKSYHQLVVAKEVERCEEDHQHVDEKTIETWDEYHAKEKMEKIMDLVTDKDKNSCRHQNSEDTNNNTKNKKLEIVIYERMGTYADCYFHKRCLSLTDRWTPRVSQRQVMNSIKGHYRQFQNTVAFLNGPVGIGKSLIGLFLAQEFPNSIYCNTFKPWQPGDVLGELYSNAEPSFSQPLILCLDEVDGDLVRIHAGIPPHREIPTTVANKAGWNKMLDEIQWGVYPYLILLLISNRPPEFIHSMDPSYLRQGRVNLTFELSSL